MTTEVSNSESVRTDVSNSESVRTDVSNSESVPKSCKLCPKAVLQSQILKGFPRFLKFKVKF